MSQKNKKGTTMITEVALKDLTLSALNVRKTASDIEVAELAHSIQSKGLIQNLTAFASKGGKKYEVVAGGRRLQALQLLAKNKVIDQSVYTVRVNVIEKADATDISLTENAMRADLHPADQFEAFKKLIDDGASVEDVAANFGVTPAVVNRRLRMASAAPEVIQAFKNGQIELDKVMALCSTEDHKLQKTFLKNKWMDADSIRNAINKSSGIDSDDRLVKFIGVDTYTAAGGQVIEDLFAREFDDGSGTTLTDIDLVQNLADEKLAELTSAAMKKGKLQWHLPNLQNTYLPYGIYEEFSQKDAKKLNGQYLGVVGLIGNDGAPKIHKYVARRSDLVKIKKILNDDESGDDTKKEVAPAILSSGATVNITKIRTKALQCAIAADPDKALKLLVCNMIKATYDFAANPCVGLRVTPALIETDVELLEDLQNQQYKACGLDLLLDDGDPKENLEELVDQLKAPQLLQITAFLSASMVNVVQGTYSLNNTSHECFTALGKKFGLNMANHFKPDQSNYFEHLPKSALVDLLGDTTLESKKKGMLALLANDRVEIMWSKGNRWLPEILRIDQSNEVKNAPAWPFPDGDSK